ncbi:hypothetical protein Q1W73_01795 [Asticcacaulis sp. ZE23SCel15]|uniref:tetratricopeptide repeat protein n=1 Tax=Asticcacaulis sp. ZE23SCel15 TaxID=3059027 RepID=UPI00265DBF86|nr:hypothetical protein [Asticcacaulis sp. ZE23SCel15]WKL57739.1 hypothetical protein Q1W73_01795 [Asticcacaulis sp. ZE23SCel15]
MQRNLSGLMAAAVIGSTFAPFHTAQAVQVHPPQTQTQADTPAKPHPKSSGPTLEMTRLFLQMSKYAKADDTAGVVATLKEMITHPDFGGLFVDIRRDLYIQLAYYQFKQKAYADAEATLDKAGALKGTPMTAGYWLMRSDLSIMMDKPAVSVAAFTQLARQFPEELLKPNPAYVFRRVYLSESLDDKAAYRDLLEALHDIPLITRGTYNAEDLWFELLEIHLADGNPDKAKAVANGFKTPYSLIRLKVDNRYQALRAVSDANIEAALETELDGYRATIKANPRQFSEVLRLVNTLMEHNRASASLAILDTELARIESAPKDRPAFEDLDETYVWAIHDRAQLLKQMGREDDAEKAFIKASQIAVNSDMDANGFIINMASFYISQSNPKAALKALEAVDLKASLFAQMAAESMRVCAYAQMGETIKITPSLDLMLKPENVSAAYLPLTIALACARDGDQLARQLILRLDDPKTRNDALMSIQAYQDAAGSTAYDLGLNAFYKQTLAREDVQAAVRKYGQIIPVPMQRMR